jgi:hypothetical protein
MSRSTQTHLPPLLLAAVVCVPTHVSGATKVDWRALADCSAAYQVNSKLADPDRPASMTAQISDVATDYAKAAERRLRGQGGASATRVRQTVADRIETKSRLLSAQPREAVERFIDACPQPDP